MNVNQAAGPWMPRIENLAFLGPVGVLSSCCTIRLGRTCRSTRMRRHRALFMPLAALCRRHSSADFTICMCEFAFRQAQWRLRSREAQLVLGKNCSPKWNSPPAVERTTSIPTATSCILLSALFLRSHVFRLTRPSRSHRRLRRTVRAKRARAAGMSPAARALRSDVVRRAASRGGTLRCAEARRVAYRDVDKSYASHRLS